MAVGGEAPPRQRSPNVCPSQCGRALAPLNPPPPPPAPSPPRSPRSSSAHYHAVLDAFRAQYPLAQRGQQRGQEAGGERPDPAATQFVHRARFAACVADVVCKLWASAEAGVPAELNPVPALRALAELHPGMDLRAQVLRGGGGGAEGEGGRPPCARWPRYTPAWT